MEDALSLQNFEDLLDPDLLDKSRLYLENGNLLKIKNTDLKWTATCKDDIDEWDSQVILDAKQRILKAHCNCSEYEVEAWETDPCKHLMAVYFAIQGKPSVSKTTKKATTKKTIKEKLKPAKEPKKPKDPAERLLGELDAKEIFEFVKTTLSKNKDFKSQFLIHFADKDSGNEQKFGEIIKNAIIAIKGRKKYMQASEAGKLATVLTPLYKQAASAEASGLFREAFNICRALLQELPNVFIILENPSVKLATLDDNNLELMAQIINNPNLPYEFKSEIYEEIKATFVNTLKNITGTSAISEQFNLLLLAAKSSDCFDDVLLILKSGIIEQSVSEFNPWGMVYQKNIWIFQQIVILYKEHIKDDKKFLTFLETYKKYLPVYLQLIDTYAAIGESTKAIACCEDIRRNLRKYVSYGETGQLESRINKIMLVELQKISKTKMAISLAKELFMNSRYQNFEYYDIEKNLTEPEEWPKIANEYADRTRKMRFNNWSEKDPAIEIYAKEGMIDKLEGYMSKQVEMSIWIKQGNHLLDLKPESFFAMAKRLLDPHFQNTYSSEYQRISQMLRMMLDNPNIRENCLDYIETLRRKYPSRESLQRILK
jgi:hypothetical protein